MRKFPFYMQIEATDCGPTCLKMVSAYYGKNFALPDLRKKAQISKEGVTLLGISEAAEMMGYRTQALKLSYELLATEAILPAILDWQQNHFVVLYKVSKDKLYVADPGKGLITYNSSEFKQHWICSITASSKEGIALFLEPTPLFFGNLNDEKKMLKA